MADPLHNEFPPDSIEAKDLARVDDNPFFCPDPGMVPELETFMDALRKSGDSVGARVNVVALRARGGAARAAGRPPRNDCGG